MSFKPSYVMKFLSLTVGAIGLLTLGACGYPTQLEAPATAASKKDRLDLGSKAQWQKSQTHSIEYFLKNAWDEQSGSFASEIDSTGNQVSENRHLIALSRMIYGLSWSSEIKGSYLRYAKRTANFLLTEMTERDNIGLYFKSVVSRDGSAGKDANGAPLAAQNVLVVNEQAYGLNGLVALYAVSQDARYLSQIEKFYSAFVERFYDARFGGFVDGYDLTTQKRVLTKSYNSTVYVATSFLLELNETLRALAPDSRLAKETEAQLNEIGRLISQHFVDTETGWIVENFTRNWRPNWRGWQKQGDSTIGVVGHNFQAAWLLLRLAEGNYGTPAETAMFKSQATTIFRSMLSKPAVDYRYGGVFDVFKREQNETMWHNNKAWWQQAEAILALTHAHTLDIKLPRLEEALEKTVGFYFKNFIDERGGEFAVVTREGSPVEQELKGSAGKSTYHTVELARYMKKYLVESRRTDK